MIRVLLYQVAIALLLVSIRPDIYSQCPTSDLNLNTQGSIDSFSINFPGCTNLDVVLGISGDDITNLDGLSSLTELSVFITGSVPNLTCLTGLSNVIRIDEAYIFGSSSLSNLSGLSNMTSMKLLWISGHDDLTSLSGLNSSIEVTQKLTVSNNPKLSDLSGLEGLTKAHDVFIQSNESLTSLQGLHNLVNLSGRAGISNNSVLAGLSGLSKLRNVEETFRISRNPKLLNFQGLNAFRSCDKLSIYENPALINFQGISNLNTVKTFEVKDNLSLENFSGLGGALNFTEIFIENNGIVNFDGFSGLGETTYFMIENNSQLVNFVGLENMSTVQYFYILNNSALIDLQGLLDLTEVIEVFEVRNNISLLGLEGLNNLESVGNGINGAAPEFTISENPNIESLDGLSGLNFVDGTFRLLNTKVPDMSGLEMFTFARTLSISNHSQLGSLDGLSSFSNAEDALYISSNPMLTNLNGILNFNSVPSELVSITNNPKLSHCSISGICNLALNYPDILSIENNKAGCSSSPEVDDICDCTTSIDYHVDIDGDFYGDSNFTPTVVCGPVLPPNGMVDNGTDCNDNDPNDVNLMIDDSPIVSGEYNANEVVLSSGTIPKMSADVTFQAPSAIYLNPMFTVEDSSVLIIILDDCGL